jgi:hypothetical protein
MNEVDRDHLDSVLAECDELLEKIDSELYRDLAEEQRLQLEIQQAALHESKEKLEKSTDDASGGAGSLSEGMHEAIVDLVKAIKETSRLLS